MDLDEASADLSTHVENPPDASALVESLRAFGYDFVAAVEDVIDNSISAKAEAVDVVMSWRGDESTVAIVDNGHGMSREDLHLAMRLGARSPLEQRAPDDLGRFGLGMKTASFSQARRLTVASRLASGQTSVAVWDLDVIARTGSWSMGTTAGPVAAALIEEHLPYSGTVVVWENPDRLVGDVRSDDAGARDAFFQRADALSQTLGVTYHRRLVGVRMTVNGVTVEPWDPFLASHTKTQTLPTEHLPAGPERTIQVTGHVLPHHSALGRDQHERAGGIHGWNAHQGLFVYRNQRLIVDGGWLNLNFRQEDHYKLARVRVDLDNRDDYDWQIDVRKERASVPDPLVADLRRVARTVRKRAEEVYRHRGTVVAGRSTADRVFVWQERKKAGRTSYRVNREHPLVRAIGRDAGRKAIGDLLRLIEETVPIASIALQHNRDPESVGDPFVDIDKSALQSLTRRLFDVLVSEERGDRDRALRRLASVEPCLSQPDLLAHLRDQIDATQDSR